MTTKRTLDYVSHVPTETREGKFLCHNHVAHGKTTKPGKNGFRAWWVKEVPPHFAACPCGWSGLPHYANAEHVEYVREQAAKKTAKPH